MARAVVDIDFVSPHAGGVERMLDQLNAAVSPEGLATFLKVKVEPYVQARAKQRFANEGDDVAGMWAPLTPATQQIRAQLGYGPTGPINRRTGELENYITQTPGLLTYDGMGASIIMPGVEPQGELAKKGPVRKAFDIVLAR